MTMMDERYSETPEAIRMLADRCVVHVAHRFELELDFSPETLGVIDHFIEAVVIEEAGGRLPPVGDARRAHLVHLLAPTIGAYFGEVLRRCVPCRWRIRSDDPREWLLEFDQYLLRFNPAGAAAEALMGEAVEAWGAAFVTAPEQMAGLHERLAAAPPLPEDEFFALTSRYEVVQIVDDWLRARAAADDEPLSLSAADYDRVFGPE
jgi:hypothetical protein